MKTSRRMCAGGFFVLSLAAGCSSSNSTPSPSSNPDGGGGGAGSGSAAGTAGCPSYVACNLLTLADVNQALGRNLTVVMEADAPLGGGLPTTYRCEYDSTNPADKAGLTFGLACNPGGLKNGPDFYNIDTSGGATAVTIPKADAAFWFPASGDGGFGLAHLKVYYGGYSLMGLSWFPSMMSDDAAKAATVQMAQVVLAKL